MKSSLIQDFMENQDEWCSDKRQEARNRFDRIMAQSCGLGIYAANAAGFTIADYFTDHYADFSRLSEVGRVNTAEQIARDMLNKLLNLSDLSRYMKPDELHNLQKTVILPQSLVNAPYGDLLRQAFETCLTEMGEQLRVSPYVESIVCCQLSAPNSLSGLKELPTWKAAYERTMSAD
ncbi:MAG: hypothetical protein LUH07_13505 [Lachnospiraceae bacterium]|nr:hypothetical protein [Lachnospiraceae bacterium]